MVINLLFKIQKFGFALLFTLIFTVNSFSQNDSAIIYEASYVSDIASNFSGGLDQASAYMGMIDLAATFNTENANLWKGGEFFIHIENTHGATPSANLTGDLQVFSNIDNGDYTYLYQMWYKQTIANLWFTIGIHDLNSEFLASDYAGEYINSSFGIMPSVSMNVPVSIFPKPVFGAMINYSISNNISVQAAAYDGNPMDLDAEPYNTKFELNNEKSLFTIGEICYSLADDAKLSGSYKLGAYYHSDSFTDFNNPTQTIKGNYGVYIIADQMLWAKGEENNKGLASFVKLGFAPKDRNEFPFFWGLGLNYYAPFKKRQDDVAGIAIANLNVNGNLIGTNNAYQHNGETVIECMYKATITQNITLQPEVQYIINPGAQSSINNAFVGLLRTAIAF